MKIFFTLFFIFLDFAIGKGFCQSVPNYNPDNFLSRKELAEYRQSIWDSMPAAVGWVNDFSGIFANDEEQTLESLIEHFEKKTSIEIAIVTLDTNMVEKSKLRQFSDRVLKTWGIGKSITRNGILISICNGYKEIKISSDVGIDKYISETDKLDIIKKYFIPYYQKNKFYDGTLSGLNALLDKLSRQM
jgi:uncharacterized protein